MTHLTREQLVDLLDRADPTGRNEPRNGPSARASSHLDACETCRAKFASLCATRAVVDGGGDIPEPSPLFWDHFSARVRDAIAADAREPRSGLRRFAWTLAGALVAVTILVALSRGSRMQPDAREPARARQGASSPADDLTSLPADASWQLITDLTATVDWDADEEAVIVRPGASDRALLDLSDAEREELARLLRAELGRRAPSL